MPERIIESPRPPRHVLPLWLVELRPLHWVKNVLIFVPLAAAHQLGNAELLGCAALAFTAFCLCASGLYVLNDWIDLESDRGHPAKRLRPLASGALSRSAAMVLILLTWGGALVLGLYLSGWFTAVLVGYVLVMMLYSMWLKHVALLDALVLAAGYAARVGAGGIAVLIRPSPWLMAFCVAIFYSLALVKRFTELTLHRGQEGASAHARGYEDIDRPMLAVFGVASGYVAVLVLALYLTSAHPPSVAYHRPVFIGLTGVLLLYWLSYIWLLANRGRVPDDPVVFALRDTRSRLLILLMGLCAFLAV